MRKNSIKNSRINGEVMKVVAQAIRFSKDPRISPMTSVMDVEVAPDLKTCKIWVSVLGNDEDRQKTLEGLTSATGYIRSTLAHTINLRNTPQLKFIMDDSIEYAIDMTKKIDEVTAHDDAVRAARKDEEIAENYED